MLCCYTFFGELSPSIRTRLLNRQGRTRDRAQVCTAATFITSCSGPIGSNRTVARIRHGVGASSLEVINLLYLYHVFTDGGLRFSIDRVTGSEWASRPSKKTTSASLMHYILKSTSCKTSVPVRTWGTGNPETRRWVRLSLPALLL